LEADKLEWSDSWPMVAESPAANFTIYQPGKWPGPGRHPFVGTHYFLRVVFRSGSKKLRQTTTMLEEDFGRLKAIADNYNRDLLEAKCERPFEIPQKCPGCGCQLRGHLTHRHGECGSFVEEDKTFVQSDTCKELVYLRAFKEAVLGNVARIYPESWEMSNTALAVSFVLQTSPEDDVKAFEAEINKIIENKKEGSNAAS